MYPFERFTEDAKKTLTLAQEEAERAHHSYIGTEHLLLGLLRLSSGRARDVLDELGIDIATVRRTIESVLLRDERIIIQQVIPTSRVKKVIEIAFDEARRMGVPEVDSGLLLVALAIEGEGIAAHVLEDLGASAERVVGGVERLMGVPPGGGRKMPRSRRRFSFRPPRVRVGETRRLVGIPREPPPRTDAETLRHLLAVQHIAALLRARGLDVERIADQLSKPPDAVVELRRQLSVLIAELIAVAGEGDYQRAAQVQARIARLATQLEKAEEDWLGKLGP
jgi:hypothetical protein